MKDIIITKEDKRDFEEFAGRVEKVAREAEERGYRKMEAEEKMKKTYCPVNGWDCPYWKKDGTCTIENPAEECDDYSLFEEMFKDYDE